MVGADAQRGGRSATKRKVLTRLPLEDIAVFREQRVFVQATPARRCDGRPRPRLRDRDGHCGKEGPRAAERRDPRRRSLRERIELRFVATRVRSKWSGPALAVGEVVWMANVDTIIFKQCRV
jgi:hypothetical protein